jgi:streptogramin lyase
MRRSAWLVLALSMLVWAPGAAADVTPDYYPFPTGYTISNFGVTADGAGNIWFTAQSPPHGSQPTPSLARLIPAQSSPGTSNGIAFFPTPDPPNVNCCANQVRGVTFNPKDGKLYYVRDDGNIGSATPAAMVAGQSTGISSTMLPGYQDLWDVAPSPAGGVWFTEHSASNVAPTYYGDRIAYYNGGIPVEGPNVAIQNGNTSLNSLRYDAQPSGIAVAKDGRPWFVEEDPGNPGYRVATYGGTGDNYDEYLISPCEGVSPCSGSFTGTGLTDVTIAPDGGIWFTNFLNRKFGRLDPDTHAMVQYTLSSIDPTLAAGQPRQITTAPDGTLWMATRQGSYNGPGNALVRIVPSATPTATVYKLAADRPPLGLNADNAGNLWFGVSNPTAPSLVGRLAGVVGTIPVPDPGNGGDGGGDGGDGGGGGDGDGGGGGGTTPAPPVIAPVPSTTPPIILKPATIGQSKLDPPQTGNGAINTNQICVGPPEARCALVYLIKEHEYVVGFPSSVNKKRKKHQPRILGTKTVTLAGGQSAKVTVKLNKLGKRILKGKHKLKVVFSATQKLANGKTKTVTKKTLTLRSK